MHVKALWGIMLIFNFLFTAAYPIPHKNEVPVLYGKSWVGFMHSIQQAYANSYDLVDKNNAKSFRRLPVSSKSFSPEDTFLANPIWPVCGQFTVNVLVRSLLASFFGKHVEPHLPSYYNFLFRLTPF